MKRFILLFILFNLIIVTSVFTQTFSVSGQVLHHNGDPFSNVEVTCSNGLSFISDLNGSFTFAGLVEGNDYEINASYSSNLFEDLTVLDAAYLRYMILEIVDYSNTQWMASDFNQTGIYQGQDYIRLTNAITQVENPSIDYIVEDHPWRFFDSNIDSLINLNAIVTGINLKNLSSNINDLKLIGVKSGNVSFEKDHIPAPASAPKSIFYIPDVSLIEDQEIVIRVKGKNMQGIVGWQHAITWDTSYLELISHNGVINDVDLYPNEEKVEDGLLRMMGINIWIDPIEDDSTIYEIRFNALQAANNLTDIVDFDTLALANQIVYVEDINFYLLEAILIIGEPTITTIDKSPKLFSFEVKPNPAIDYLNFSIQLTQPEISVVSLYDSTGKLIQSESFESQSIKSKINTYNLPIGIYHLQLKTATEFRSQSFSKL